MCNAYNEKLNRTAKSRKNQNGGRKGRLQVFGIREVDTIK